MGASVAAAAAAGGARVRWCTAGRSAETRRRAEAAGLEAVPDLAALCAHSDLLLSVCPPDRAARLAADVARCGFAGTFADLNAVSPRTTRSLADVFAPGPVRFVDGGLIGPPAWRPGTTRLYLSGARAAAVAACFAGTPLEACVVGGSIGAASALKMVFAAWTKGTTALLAATLAAAEANGVQADLLAEWEKTQPSLPGRARGLAPAVAAKAWRFEGEMREIAGTFEQAGLPGGFHVAAAEVYSRLAGFKGADPPELAALLARLRKSAD